MMATTHAAMENRVSGMDAIEGISPERWTPSVENFDLVPSLITFCGIQNHLVMSWIGVLGIELLIGIPAPSWPSWPSWPPCNSGAMTPLSRNSHRCRCLLLISWVRRIEDASWAVGFVGQLDDLGDRVISHYPSVIHGHDPPSSLLQCCH